MSSLLAWAFAFINPEYAQKLGIYLPGGLFKFESLAPIAGKIDLGYVLHPTNIGGF
ncbi:cation symporter-2 domain protein [Clostridioides difficile DA00165]|nr:cation symporter-2 domain protein [Clostridioides difficile DA00165]